MVIRGKIEYKIPNQHNQEGNLEVKVFLAASRSTFLEKNRKLLLFQDQVYT